jgi:hypothetical protein
MTLLKNFAILFATNILLTVVSIATIYFLGSSERSFQLPDSFIDGLAIFFLLAQLFITFKILKARGIFSGLNYVLCITGIIAVWLCFIFYFIHRMQS